jgi:hypothetical protein
MAVVKRFFASRFCKFADARNIPHTEAFFGTAHAGGIDIELLQLFLQCGRAYRSVEVALHPGEIAGKMSPEDKAAGWHDPLARQRPLELEMLVSAELPERLAAAGWRLGRISG